MNSAKLIPARVQAVGAQPTTETGPRGLSHDAWSGARVGGHHTRESRGGLGVGVQPRGEV
jgi:hypothetical protein